MKPGFCFCCEIGVRAVFGVDGSFGNKFSDCIESPKHTYTRARTHTHTHRHTHTHTQTHKHTLTNTRTNSRTRTKHTHTHSLHKVSFHTRTNAYILSHFPVGLIKQVLVPTHSLGPIRFNVYLHSCQSVCNFTRVVSAYLDHLSRPKSENRNQMITTSGACCIFVLFKDKKYRRHLITICLYFCNCLTGL